MLTFLQFPWIYVSGWTSWFFPCSSIFLRCLSVFITLCKKKRRILLQIRQAFISRHFSCLEQSLLNLPCANQFSCYDVKGECFSCSHEYRFQFLHKGFLLVNWLFTLVLVYLVSDFWIILIKSKCAAVIWMHNTYLTTQLLMASSYLRGRIFYSGYFKEFNISIQALYTWYS